MPQLKSALNEWKSVEGTIAAQLLDPGIKDTLLASDEKVATGQKFQAVFSKYVGQQGSVHAPQPKAVPLGIPCQLPCASLLFQASRKMLST